ncbi:N-acetylmannosaminyltransferase [Thermodesulfitimonas autotrophica]|uniref:N-acetylglucosaminyldiphosphoundecaprenol N-acetyl-beta-D-mannosaminyltransferase n=1 Tax=Thermodesulfitimonas autotrophica TaxID=1894989 RepID=A0A3N5BC60_9THEO|nr:WecB/TagA/CpsF family glycosyltransferase [Thermodesulfitimonas autotrophica]RPF47218.1 N-acetylmannosaminyltransferase [Thermodesulfitimonas autotrophica]
MTQRINILGAPVDAVTVAAAVARVSELIARGGTHQVVTLNPEYLYRAQREPDLLAIAREASLVTADGVGIVWAASVHGYSLPERVTGIDLLVALCDRAAAEGWRVFFLGGQPGVAAAAASRLKAEYPGLMIAGEHHGYFTADEEAMVLEKIKAAAPQLLFVGLGAPKQERWIYKYRQQLGNVVAMGVGGSFDVLSGRTKRAPAWMQRWGLEWLGRLFYEPHRWRRMLVLPRFALLVLRAVKGNP